MSNKCAAEEEILQIIGAEDFESLTRDDMTRLFMLLVDGKLSGDQWGVLTNRAPQLLQKTRVELVEEIQNISGIKDFSKIGNRESADLLRLIGEQRLEEAHVKALVEIAPHFVSLAMESLKAISVVAEKAGESQSDALDVLKTSVSGLTVVLERLADKSTSDETREKIAICVVDAGKLYVELAKIVRDINKDNNDTWVRIAKIAAVVVLAVASAAAAAWATKKTPQGGGDA